LTPPKGESGLLWLLMNCFELVPIEVKHKCGVIGRAVLDPESGVARRFGPDAEGLGMEGVDGCMVGRSKRQVKSRSRSEVLVFSVRLERQLVVAVGRSVSDCGIGRPDPDVAERCEDGVVEGSGAVEVAHSQ